MIRGTSAVNAPRTNAPLRKLTGERASLLFHGLRGKMPSLRHRVHQWSSEIIVPCVYDNLSEVLRGTLVSFPNKLLLNERDQQYVEALHFPGNQNGSSFEKETPVHHDARFEKITTSCFA